MEQQYLLWRVQVVSTCPIQIGVDVQNKVDMVHDAGAYTWIINESRVIGYTKLRLIVLPKSHKTEQAGISNFSRVETQEDSLTLKVCTVELQTDFIY
jgi:hypothetical protein